MEKVKLLEYVRIRPAMFLGATNYSGILELLTHLIEDFNEIGIYEISFSLKEDNQIIIEGSSIKSLHSIQEFLLSINDYSSKNLYLSFIEILGLSEFAEIKVFDQNSFLKAKAYEGKTEIITDKIHSDFLGIKIDLKLDKTIFKEVRLNYESLNALFRRFAFLNSHIKIKSIDDSSSQKQINFFHYPKGLIEIIDIELEKVFIYDSVSFKLNFTKNTKLSYSVALAFISSYWIKPEIKVYANYKETILGGSLLDGLLMGFKKFFNEESLKRNLKLRFSTNKLKRHLLLYASVEGELTYFGSTKWKLGTPQVQNEIKGFIYEELKSYFFTNEEKLIAVLNVLQNGY